jgi:hypothetical protein
MLIVSPRASRMAPRHADVIPFPKDETTPPVINTYDVMYESVVNGALQIVKNLLEARNKKGLDQKRLANLEVNRMLSSNPSNSTPSLD